MIISYLGTSGLAERLGVSRQAVSAWRARYSHDSSHPFPLPDIDIDGVPGWKSTRVSEVEEWRAGLPGRGAGGGRPSTSERMFLAALHERGFDRREAMALASSMMEVHPELSKQEIYAVLLNDVRDAQTWAATASERR